MPLVASDELSQHPSEVRIAVLPDLFEPIELRVTHFGWRGDRRSRRLLFERTVELVSFRPRANELIHERVGDVRVALLDNGAVSPRSLERFDDGLPAFSRGRESLQALLGGGDLVSQSANRIPCSALGVLEPELVGGH